MARKGQFKKGGGRVGSGHTKKRSKSRAMVHTKTRYVTRSAPKKHRRRRGGGKGGGMPRLLPLAITAAGLAYLTGANGPTFVKENVAKIPGVKTFGAPATLGLGALAVDRFVKPNRWLKLAGVAGLVLAAFQVGTKGPDFKWVGDGEYSGDLEGDDLGDDDVGDDDTGVLDGDDD
jgi:hypothetical protein